MVLNARLIVQKANSEQLILLAIEDISTQKRIEKELMEAKMMAEAAQKKAESATAAKQHFL